jgi:hypothetical protein
VPEFKICLLNDSGHVTARPDVIYDDIEAALAHASASASEHAVTVEVWEGAACVDWVPSPLQPENQGDSP